MQCHFDRHKVCPALERPAYLEPFELRCLRNAVSCTGNRGQPEHSMGKLPAADGGDLGAGICHRVESATAAHNGDLRDLILRLRLSAQLDHARSLAVRNCADHGPHVSTVYFFHDYRSEDDSSIKAWANCGCVFHRRSRDDFAAQASCLRPVLRFVYGRACGTVTRNVACVATESS